MALSTIVLEKKKNRNPAEFTGRRSSLRRVHSKVLCIIWNVLKKISDQIGLIIINVSFGQIIVINRNSFAPQLKLDRGLIVFQKRDSL